MRPEVKDVVDINSREHMNRIRAQIELFNNLGTDRIARHKAHQSEVYHGTISSEEKPENDADLITRYKLLVSSYAIAYQNLVKKDDAQPRHVVYHKRSVEDIELLEKQLQHLSKIYNLLTGKKDPEDRSLDIRIADTASLEYKISEPRLIARRIGLVLSVIAVSAAVIGISLLLLTPVGQIGAIGTGVFLGLMAIGALLGLRGPVHTSRTLNVGGMPLTAQMPVPASPVVLLQAVVVPWVFRRKIASWSISPTKEVAAREVQAGIYNQLIAECRQKLETGTYTSPAVKQALEKAIDYAENLFDRGNACYFDGSRKSRLQKSRVMLQATASILEDPMHVKIESLAALRNIKFGDSDDENAPNFLQVLDSRRNSSFDSIWSSGTSGATSAVFPNGITDDEKTALILTTVTAMATAF